MNCRVRIEQVLPDSAQPVALRGTAAHAPSGPIDAVRLLMVLRTIALGGQSLAIVVSSALDVALPIAAMSAVVAVLVAANALTWLRLGRPAPASRYEIAGHAALDLAAFTALLYLSGGAANPFALIYVLHVVVMALLLPPLPAAVGTLMVVASYSLVARVHLPLKLDGGEPVSAALLGSGHWLSLALTAIVVGWFIARVVAALREHERLLRDAAQKALNDEAILKLGALAAGAAHELATPMTTMAVVAGEMAREANTPSLRRDIGVLSSQIQACRQTISNLLAAAGHARAEGGGRERLDAFLRSLDERFRAMRPDVLLTSQWEGVEPVPHIFAEQALKQSVLALLNNAGDASPHDVRLTARWGDEALRVAIEDRGGGVPDGHLEKLGRVVFTTKPPGQGMGLGLVLAATSIRQLGGTLRWEKRPAGGTRAEIALPLRALAVAGVDR